MAWYREYLRLNPSEKERRDRILNYAEDQGGVTGEYLRRLFPHFWFKAEWVPPGGAGRSMGLSRAEEERIILDMAAKVLPPTRTSTFSEASSIAMPDGVGHL